MSEPLTSPDNRNDHLTELPPTIHLGHDAGAAVPCPIEERFGEYRLLGELGRGGMGVVFKAHEERLDRYVAVKMILPGSMPDAEDLQRFQTEAAAAACLQHPNIVGVHRVGVQDNRPFYSMDLVEGPSLTKRLAKGPLPGRTAARYMAAVARAIDHAHQHGVLHRDLKPSNILLDGADQPHVTDFGLAKRYTADHGQTRTGAILGTPSYMAPEQASGVKEIGPACDIYGLGALLYELLTGRPPFKAETPVDTIMQVLEREPAPPRLLNPKIDRDLETICLKCLQKDPAHRYPTAAAVAEDLERYLNGVSIQARSFSMIDRLAWSLEHSQYDAEFGAYGVMLYWFAAIVFVSHILKEVMLESRVPVYLVLGMQVVQLGLLGGIFWVYRAGRVRPATTAERQLWTVWIGYIAATFMVAFVSWGIFKPDQIYEMVEYPFFAIVAGLAFFVLGSSYWGWCYAFGVGFFLLAAVMLLTREWAVVEFGLGWTACLVLLGARLRRLGKERAAGSP